MERVQVYRAGAPAVRDGRGLFAEALLEALPSLPVEEEGRLNDAPLRENFIERVFAYRRLRDLFAGDWRLRRRRRLPHRPQAPADGARAEGLRRAGSPGRRR